MVRIRDEGSGFDAALDVVWRFLQPPETHLAAHKGERNHRIEASGPNTMLAHWEMQAGDRWMPVTNRVTYLPRVATIIESLEGPMKGTKVVHAYTASGARTRVDVYGEFVIVGVPDGETEAAAAGDSPPSSRPTPRRSERSRNGGRPDRRATVTGPRGCSERECRSPPDRPSTRNARTFAPT